MALDHKRMSIKLGTGVEDQSSLFRMLDGVHDLEVHTQPPYDLRRLPRLSSLVRLNVFGNAKHLPDDLQIDTLQQLEFYDCKPWHKVLGRCTARTIICHRMSNTTLEALRENASVVNLLVFEGALTTCLPMRELPSLSSLRLSLCRNIRSLEGVPEWIRCVNVYTRAVEFDASEIQRMVNLKALSVSARNAVVQFCHFTSVSDIEFLVVDVKSSIPPDWQDVELVRSAFPNLVFYSIQRVRGGDGGIDGSTYKKYCLC